MRSNSLFWGAVLVVLGGLFLLGNLEILQVNVWYLIWPVFLILLGVWILVSMKFRNRSIEVENAAIPLAGAREAEIVVHHGAGRLSINADYATDELVKGTFGGGLATDKSVSGARVKLDMRPRLNNQPDWFFPWSWGNHARLDWDLLINREIPVRLELHTGADEARIDLSEMQVNELVLHTGASQTDIKLSATTGNSHVRLEGGAASINIAVPGGVAARIRSNSGVSSISIDQTRFPNNGSVYQSPDYETATNKVDIDIQIGAGSVNVN